jgi:hypothetical protein
MKNINLRGSDNIQVAEYWGESRAGSENRPYQDKRDSFASFGNMGEMISGLVIIYYMKNYVKYLQYREYTCKIKMKISIASTFQGGKILMLTQLRPSPALCLVIEIYT